MKQEEEEFDLSVPSPFLCMNDVGRQRHAALGQTPDLHSMGEAAVGRAFTCVGAIRHFGCERRWPLPTARLVEASRRRPPMHVMGSRRDDDLRLGCAGR